MKKKNKNFCWRSASESINEKWINPPAQDGDCFELLKAIAEQKYLRKQLGLIALNIFNLHDQVSGLFNGFAVNDHSEFSRLNDQEKLLLKESDIIKSQLIMLADRIDLLSKKYQEDPKRQMQTQINNYFAGMSRSE